MFGGTCLDGHEYGRMTSEEAGLGICAGAIFGLRDACNDYPMSRYGRGFNGMVYRADAWKGLPRAARKLEKVKRAVPMHDFDPVTIFHPWRFLQHVHLTQHQDTDNPPRHRPPSPVPLHQQHLRPIPRQPHPKQLIRLLPPIRPRVKALTPPELVLREVQVPIRRHRQRVRPPDARVPDERRKRPVVRGEDSDALRLDVAAVDQPVGVGFQPVADALGAVVDDRGLGEDLGGWAGVPQARRGDAVEIPRAHRAPVEGFPVGGERDAVGAEGDVGDGEAGAGEGVDGFAPDVGDDLLFGADGGVAVEVAPGQAGAEVEGYEAVAAFGAGVGDVGDAEAGGREVRAEVEADVVEVLCGGVVSVGRVDEGMRRRRWGEGASRKWDGVEEKGEGMGRRDSRNQGMRLSAGRGWLRKWCCW